MKTSIAEGLPSLQILNENEMKMKWKNENELRTDPEFYHTEKINENETGSGRMNEYKYISILKYKTFNTHRRED